MGAIHMRPSHRKLLSGFAALAAALGSGTGLAIATSDAVTTARATPALSTVPQVLIDRFGVFRAGPATEAEAATAAMRYFASGINEQFGLNVALARRASGGPTWVVPGAEGVCIFVPGIGEGGCTSIANAGAGNLVIALGDTVYGLVPDGNPTITIHNADGAIEHIAVSQNVYVIEHRRATSVDIQDSTGKTHSVEVP
jgi:hypothetical protein